MLGAVFSCWSLSTVAHSILDLRSFAFRIFDRFHFLCKMGSHVDTTPEVPTGVPVAEAPDTANATADSARAPGTGEAVPYGVPGATPTHVGGVASPKASSKPSPRDEAASLPSSDEEAVDKRAAEPGDEPPAKKSRLRKEIHGLVKVVKEVVIGLTASTSTLDSTNESLQQAKKEIDALCIQLGVDQVSAKYFLTSMQQYSNTMNNISWQVTGSKSQVNPTLKELCRDLNEKINKGNRCLTEIKDERRAQHELTLQYLKGIENAMDRMTGALGRMSVVAAAPAAPPVAAPAAPPVAAPVAVPAATPATPSVAAPGVPISSVGTVGGPMPAPAHPVVTKTTPAGFPPAPPTAVSYAFSPPAAPAAPTMQRPGRIRVRTSDGTEIVRAVSPNPARRDSIPVGWAEEYGMGTLQLGNLVYRVISDEFIRTSVALN